MNFLKYNETVKYFGLAEATNNSEDFFSAWTQFLTLFRNAKIDLEKMVSEGGLKKTNKFTSNLPSPSNINFLSIVYFIRCCWFHISKVDQVDGLKKMSRGVSNEPIKRLQIHVKTSHNKGLYEETNEDRELKKILVK